MNSLFKTRFCIIYYDMQGNNLDCEFVAKKQEAIEDAQRAIKREALKGCKMYAEIHNELNHTKSIRIE